MYLCYIDESGTSDLPGNTSHFILAGISIPIWHWKDTDREICLIKKKYGIESAEIHTAWILRSYLEQKKIKGFISLNYDQRRSGVEKLRKAALLKAQRHNSKSYKQKKKTFNKTQPYIHLTYDERVKLVRELAECVSKWGFARLFAECIDKIYFDPTKSPQPIEEQAFEQVVSRFEQYLESIAKDGQKNYGLLIHDNNETVCKKHTLLMKRFHEKGTFWTKLNNIIETPLFVDSELTSMVQIADLCSYSLRRYLENNEEELFNLVFNRADRKNNFTVGVRHYSEKNCKCRICDEHKK